MDALARNKQNVQAFYKMAFTEGKPAEAVALYVGDQYIQHNPHVADGKDGFIAYFERMAAEYPEKDLEFKRVIAEGDLVMVHTLQTWANSDDYITMDIFRCDADGKILEHWDVMQVVPSEMAHDNGMF
jgi:predicted SnoaL-like aldol condensation-catalyzing enzyme